MPRTVQLISPERILPGRAKERTMSETIIIRRTGQAPLRVRGEVIAKSESSWNNASPGYSGSAGRKQTVRIIKTASVKYVVAILHETQWQGEHDTEEANVLTSLQECIAYLSGIVPGWIARGTGGCPRRRQRSRRNHINTQA